jgi:hypothetical protein
MPELSPSVDESNIGLAEMIENLRTELESSVKSGKGRAVAFDVDKVELELKVSISRKKGGEVGIAFWVVKAGGNLEGAQDNSHTFNLTLLPVSGVTGDRLKVASYTDVGPQRN